MDSAGCRHVFLGQIILSLNGSLSSVGEVPEIVNAFESALSKRRNE